MSARFFQQWVKRMRVVILNDEAVISSSDLVVDTKKRRIAFGLAFGDRLHVFDYRIIRQLDELTWEINTENGVTFTISAWWERDQVDFADRWDRSKDATLIQEAMSEFVTVPGFVEGPG